METSLLALRRKPTRTRSRMFQPQAESLEGRALLARVLALTDTALVQFETSPLGPVAGGSLAFSGAIGAGEIVRAIDVRTTNNTLYALTTKDILGAGNLVEGKLYSVQLNPGSAIFTPAPNSFLLSVTSTAAPGIGMDFDPNADELRVVTDAGVDVVVDPVTGGAKRYDRFIAGGNLVALTHQFGANPTALVGYNYLADQIVSVNPAAGTVANLVASGITASARNSVGLDIDATSNTAFLVSQVAAGPRFLTVNLGTNTVSPAQDIGILLGGAAVRDIALAPVSGVHLSQSTYFVQASTGNAPIVITRTGGTTLDAVTVRIATANDTAVAGTDYQTVNMDVTIPAGAQSFTVNVPLLNTTQSSADKTFTVALTQAAGSTVIPSAPTNAPVTILAHNPDLTPPTIVTARPSTTGRRNNRVLRSFTLTFSELLDSNRALNDANYVLRLNARGRGGQARRIPVTVTYDPTQNTVVLTPTVRARLQGGGSLEVLSAAPLAQPTGFRPGSQVTTQIPAAGATPNTITVPNLPNNIGISDAVGNPLTPNNPSFRI